MSFEPLYVELWIYATLHDDDTLTDALAAVTGEAPGYQQGIYMHLAPQRDRVSGKPPKAPYIVVTREQGGEDSRTICGDRYRSDIFYRVTVWDSQNGAVAMDRVTTVADRADVLIDNVNQATTDPHHIGNRVQTGTEVEIVAGGEVMYGAWAVYKFTVRST